MYTHYTLVATSAVILSPSVLPEKLTIIPWPLWIFFSSILKYSGISQYHPSQTDGMVDSALGFSEKIWHILINFRKPLYASKWFCFFSFLWGSGLGPAMAGLPTMSDFLISLHEGVFGHCSLKVYLAAIAVFHVQIEDYSVFSHPLLKHFLKGFLNLSPPVPPQLVFCHLTGHLLPPSSKKGRWLFYWPSLLRGQFPYWLLCHSPPFLPSFHLMVL